MLTSASWLRGCCCSSKWRLLKSKVGAFVEFYTFLSLACLLLRTVWLSLIKEEDTMFRKCSICFLFFYCLPGGRSWTKMKNCWYPSLFCSMGDWIEWKVIIRNSVFFIKYSLQRLKSPQCLTGRTSIIITTTHTTMAAALAAAVLRPRNLFPQ